MVFVIFACGGLPAAFAAKAATTTIPIPFATPGDPVGSAFMIRLPRIVEAPKEEVAAPARTGAAALKPQ